MSVTASIPKLVSGKILRTLENELVAKQICTMEPDAPIKKVGDTVYFSGLNDPTIDDYTGAFTYEGITDGSVALLIDQKKKYAFKVNDVEAFQSNIDIKGSQVQRAGYGLKNQADAYVFGLHASAGNAISATVTESNVLSTTSKIFRLLEEKNVMNGDAWIVVAPWYAELLRLAGIKFQINNGMEGEEGGMQFANFAGANKIFVSNNIVTTGSEGSKVSKIMGGSYNSIVFAEQLMKNRYIPELENDFAGGASGLMVYGAKVIKPEELVTLTATQGAISTI